MVESVSLTSCPCGRYYLMYVGQWPLNYRFVQKNQGIECLVLGPCRNLADNCQVG